MPSLTFQEKEAMEELRRRMKNDISQEMFDDDNMFYRFLKARDFKVDLAESMLRKDLAWRRAYQVDTILVDYKLSEVMQKYLSDSLIGYDKENRPVLYSAVGSLDDEGLLKSIKATEFYRYFIYNIERNVLLEKKQTKKTGKLVSQAVLIYDLKNLTFAKGTNKRNLQNFRMLITMVQDHYPERLKTLYIINAPVYFTIIFNILKVFIADAVLHKIQAFSSDGWKEALLQVIDADVLPEFLGGQRTDPDGNPLCHSVIIHGSKVPERLYICNSRKPMWERADAHKLLIPALSKNQIERNVDECNCILEWEYETRHGDIGFGLFYQENYSDSSKAEELIPICKIQSCDGSETGMFRCDRLGTYILVFDNSYSYFNQKELYYKIVIRKLSDRKNCI